MKSPSVRLLPPEPDDYLLLARWAATTGGIGARTNGGAEISSADELQHAARSGAFRILMVDAGAAGRIGAVSWAPSSSNGYSIGAVIGDPARWNRGAGVEAVFLLLDHLFHARNAHRVEAVVGTHNPQGISLLTKGFWSVEGIMRDYFFVDGAYHDAVMFSLLRDEYYAFAATSLLGPIPDVVPAEDKAAARRRFQAYLARLPTDPLRALASRQSSLPESGSADVGVMRPAGAEET